MTGSDPFAGPAIAQEPEGSPKLKRALSWPLLSLYGLGVTLGAGMYVIVGATAEQAGIYAPISFLIAAAIVGGLSPKFLPTTSRALGRLDARRWA